MAKTRNRYISEAFQDTVRHLNNKYYNLFRKQIKVTGIDYRQEDYLMRKLYKKGTIAAYKIKGADEIGFASWAMNTHDMYNMPETVSLINEYSSPLIPSSTQIVDRDVVLGWLNYSRGADLYSMKQGADYYIKRIAQVEVVINNNLEMHKLPFLLAGDDAEKAKIEDIVQRIIDGELVIFADGVDPNIFKCISTGQPYLLDKLKEYEVGLMNELKTELGIDNQGAALKREQVNLDDTNANNAEINDNIDLMVGCLNKFASRVKETLGFDIHFERTSQKVDAISSTHVGEKSGPKEGEDDE